MNDKGLWWQDERIVAAGRDGAVLYLACLGYSVSQGHDGYVSSSAVAWVAETFAAEPIDTAALLVRLGLWEAQGDGYAIPADTLERWQAANGARRLRVVADDEPS